MEDFKEYIKFKIKDSRELNEFLKKFETNPRLLKSLSSDRLDKLIQHYKKITEQKRIEIERLKKMV